MKVWKFKSRRSDRHHNIKVLLLFYSILLDNNLHLYSHTHLITKTHTQICTHIYTRTHTYTYAVVTLNDKVKKGPRNQNPRPIIPTMAVSVLSNNSQSYVACPPNSREVSHFSPHLISSHLTPCLITPHFTLPYFTSPHIVSPHLTLSRIVLSLLAVLCLTLVYCAMRSVLLLMT